MLIITPTKGLWAEPRPQYLVTGDRATQVLDAASSAALQASGVKLTTLSPTMFSKLVDELIPEQVEGIDPGTGKFDPALMPDYLSPTGIADVDIRGSDGKIEETYLPARLSPAALAALAGAGASTTATNTDITVTGTATIATTNTTDLTATGTVTLGATTASSVETAQETLVNQSVAPSSPAAGKTRLWADTNGRLSAKNNSGTVFLIGNKRVVSSWPSDSQSFLGDEAVNSTTGEHRVYLGVTKGWRLASPHTVSSLAERDAITNKYAGLKVYCAFGAEQDQVFGTDNKWHGTKSWLVPAGSNHWYSNVNDTNWRTRNTTDVLDPGFDYVAELQLAMTIEVAKQVRTYLHLDYSDYQLRTNVVNYYNTYRDVKTGSFTTFCGYDLTGSTPVLSGAHSLYISWRVSANFAAAKNTGVGEAAAPVYRFIPA